MTTDISSAARGVGTETTVIQRVRAREVEDAAPRRFFVRNLHFSAPEGDGGDSAVFAGHVRVELGPAGPPDRRRRRRARDVRRRPDRLFGEGTSSTSSTCVSAAKKGFL